METATRRGGERESRVFELNSPRGSIERGPRLWPRSAVEYRQLVKSNRSKTLFLSTVFTGWYE